MRIIKAIISVILNLPEIIMDTISGTMRFHRMIERVEKDGIIDPKDFN